MGPVAAYSQTQHGTIHRHDRNEGLVCRAHETVLRGPAESDEIEPGMMLAMMVLKMMVKMMISDGQDDDF